MRDRPLGLFQHRPLRRRLAAVGILLAVAALAWALGTRWLGALPSGTLQVNGTLEAVEILVSSEVPARVTGVLVGEGESVRKGDPLVLLDSSTVELQRRLAGPVEQQLLALQLEKYTLRAPKDGRVLRRAVEPGEVAVPGAGLLTVADTTHLELTVYVLQRDLGWVATGAPVLVRAEALPRDSFEGRVISIADKAEFTPRNTQTPKDRLNLVFAVKIALDGSDDRLKPGLSVSVRFQS